MNDTSPDVAAGLDALKAERSGGERVRMACEMFDLAKALVVASITANEPDIHADDLRVRLFERLYGDDFSLEERTRIITSLSSPARGA